jgi:hypothetical protein
MDLSPCGEIESSVELADEFICSESNLSRASAPGADNLLFPWSREDESSIKESKPARNHSLTRNRNSTRGGKIGSHWRD